MTLLQMLKEIRDMGALDRVRRLKCADGELELGAPVDTESKVVELKIPESQSHGTPISETELRQREDDEAREILYGAGAARTIPSDYGPT